MPTTTTRNNGNQRNTLSCEEKKRLAIKIGATAALMIFCLVVIVGLPFLATERNERRNGILGLYQTETEKMLFEVEKMVSELKVDQCKNFYSFCCPTSSVKYRKNRIQKLTDTFINLYKEKILESDDNLIKMHKRMFAKCVDQDSIISNIFPAINQIHFQLGGWPVIEEKWAEVDFDWINATYKMRELGYDYRLFLQMDLVADVDTNNVLLQVSIPKIEDCKNEKFMINVGKMLEKDAKISLEELSEVHKFVDKIKKVQEVTYITYERFQIAQYQKKVPAIDWLAFIKDIGNYSNEISSIDEVIFPSAEIMSKWIDVIKETPKRTLANYMLWKLAEEMFAFGKLALNYYGLINVPNQVEEMITNREKFCLDELLSRFFPNPIIMKHFTNTDREVVMNSLKSLKPAMIDVINKEVVGVHKATILKTLAEMGFVTGIGFEYCEKEMSKNMNCDKNQLIGDTFFDILMRASKHHLDWKFGLIKHPELFKYIGEGYYNRVEYLAKTNMINVPLRFAESILQAKEPCFIKYSRLGVLVYEALASVSSQFDLSLIMINNGNTSKISLPLYFTQKLLNDIYYKHAPFLRVTSRYKLTAKQIFWVAFFNDMCNYTEIDFDYNIDKNVLDDFKCKTKNVDEYYNIYNTNERLT